MSYISSMSTASSQLSSLSTLKGGEVNIQMDDATAVLIVAAGALTYFNLNIHHKSKDPLWANMDVLYLILAAAAVAALKKQLPKGSSSAAAGALAAYAASVTFKELHGKHLADVLGLAKSPEGEDRFDWAFAGVAAVAGAYMARR